MRFISLLLFLNAFLSVSQEDSTSVDELPYTFPMTIRYENNKAEISHIHQIRLDVLAEYMIAHPSLKILIEGHVCCGPQYGVSKRRARSVYRYLRKLDVPKEQMAFVGRSFDEPKVRKERNEDDKHLNRRVEIELLSR